MMSDDDDSLKIRPPQPARSSGGIIGSRGQSRSRNHPRDYPGNHPGNNRGGPSRNRDNNRRGSDTTRRDNQHRNSSFQRNRNQGRRDDRPRQGSGGGDLRDRINRSEAADGHRGLNRDSRYPTAGESRSSSRMSEEERAKREQRLKKFMSVEAEPKGSRRDLEERRRERKRMERERVEVEDRMKRKRDRSAEGETRKKLKNEEEKANSGEEEEEDDSDESGEEEDSNNSSDSEEEESGEEESEENESDEEEVAEQSGEEHIELSDETTSEKSGHDTPEEVSDGQESPEVRSKSRSKKKKKKKHKKRRKSLEEGEREETPEDEHHKELNEDHTPVRSPTPLREDRQLEDHYRQEARTDDDPSDDEDDHRLEAALRGEHRKEQQKGSADDNESSPKSQGSFGEEIHDENSQSQQEQPSKKKEEENLPPYLPSIYGCRSVEEFKCLNRIEEGTYGVVYRARDKKTSEIVALKRLKMEREKEGFPITSLREINTLLISQHVNVVTVREIVVGSNMDKIFIVMDFVEHDLKSLMETMREKKQVFLPGEVKCLMIQLLRAIGHLHDNWILHRDLKTSNLLLSHNGILKVGDFGLAREYGSPLKPYTPIVVTLWYRAPELLLGQKEYSTHIDVWSCGCIFGELLHMEPLFCGKSEGDQLNKIFKLLGTPSEKIWPGYSKLPLTQKMKFVDYPISHLKSKFPSQMLTEMGLNFMKQFLTYDPKKRISCEEGLRSEYFKESPTAIDPSMFPTWPAKSELSASEKTSHKKASSPKPPSGGGAYKNIENDDEVIGVAGGGALAGAGASVGGFDFVARNSTSNLAEWKLKF